MLLAPGQGRFSGTGDLHDAHLAEKLHNSRDLALVPGYFQCIEVGAHIYHLRAKMSTMRKTSARVC